MSKGTVITVEDDSDLQLVMSQYLESEGYDVICAASGEELRSVLEKARANVILLDLGLPDMDGLSVLGMVRAQGKKTPVIVVSGKSDTTEKIVCLEMGADDYMTKPFEMRELSARMKAVLRRKGEGADDEKKAQKDRDDADAVSVSRVKFGSWILDRAKLQLYDEKNESADLTTGEFKLLDILVSAHNRVMSRDQLFDLTRETDYDSFDRAVDIQIGRLRKKLNDDPKEPLYIKTVRGAGYIFTADIEELE